ncbi:unnamed protein product [Hermetia illucens]|uniref:Uncharacterized protein n=1 Tax=Hermetia illucens TaxID=343691 RepID=A0A7R8UL42_HERIL|nr:unnamed protein product [Hermetia illucens]
MSNDKSLFKIPVFDSENYKTWKKHDENFEIDENSENESLDETFESIGENSEIHDNENKLKIPRRVDIPYTFEEAINSEESKNWIKAMNKEIESLKSNNTWELIENTENKKVIDVKWGCKNADIKNSFIILL